jgi:hypothetical protein
MSIETLWSMQCASANDEGAGVVVLETDRSFEGDSQCTST